MRRRESRIEACEFRAQHDVDLGVLAVTWGVVFPTVTYVPESDTTATRLKALNLFVWIIPLLVPVPVAWVWKRTWPRR